jgi:hypothetical protein
MSSTASNKVKYAVATGVINFSSDSFKIILMATGFTFNKDTHHGFADVSASELATNYGYVRNTKTLSGVAVTEDDTNDKCAVTWSNASWTASGGDIGPTPGAIIFDDTVAAPTADVIVGYIDFGGDQTQVNGGIATIANIEFDLS